MRNWAIYLVVSNFFSTFADEHATWEGKGPESSDCKSGGERGNDSTTIREWRMERESWKVPPWHFQIRGDRCDDNILIQGSWWQDCHLHLFIHHLTFSIDSRININKQEKERELIMGVYIGFVVIAIPCILFLLYCLTPRGKHWLRMNGLLWQDSGITSVCMI